MHGEYRGEIAKIRQKAIIDRCLETCKENRRFRCTVGAFWMRGAWWENTPEEEKRNTLIELNRQGRISVSASSHNYRSASMSAELLNSVCHPAEAFRKSFGIRPETAVMNDVPTWNWSLVRPLVKSGIRYFLAGPNLFIGGRLSIPLNDMPFWWEGPDGSRILTSVCGNSSPTPRNCHSERSEACSRTK